jgi:hypothetical protein
MNRDEMLELLTTAIKRQQIMHREDLDAIEALAALESAGLRVCERTETGWSPITEDQ